MRPLLAGLALAVVVAGCGGAASAPPPDPAALQARCVALLESAGGPFGCRLADLSAGLHTVTGEAHTYAVDVGFRADGRVERFRGLRPVGRRVRAGAAAPDCVARVVRALRLPAPGAAFDLPLTVRYVPGARPYAAALATGGCALTLPPAP